MSMTRELTWACLALACYGQAAAQVQAVQQPQRLSNWLRQQPPLVHPLGLAWQTPEALAEQRLAHADLLASIQTQAQQQNLPPQAAAQLQSWLQALPPTGRVRLPAVDADWLEANPKRDPMLQQGDSLVLSTPAQTVRVLSDDGLACELAQRPGLRAQDYVRACMPSHLSWAWLVQPDGRMQRVGLDAWNQGLQNEPAPGAWIWVARNADLPEAFHQSWAQWLAWQGPSNRVSAQALTFTQVPAPEPTPTGWADITGRGLVAEPTSSDWGNVGLLQTPTARMRSAGNLNIHMHRVSPYRQIAVMLQPLSWLETGFRYVSIENRLYGAEDFSGDQSYKDKSIDLKLRLWQESRYWPELALGWRDMGGTGLFSGEYLVASKRWGRLDASLGMGWGYLGNRAMFENPLAKLGGERFNTRPNEVGNGGTFGAGSWFRGTTSLFGGLEYESPWNLNFKVEYDPGNYQNEPLRNKFEVSSPLNWGVVYRPTRGVELSLGLNRGKQLAFAWSLQTDLSGLNMPKLTDPPLPRPRANRDQTPPEWSQVARDLERHTQWRVDQIVDGQDRVTVKATQSLTPAPKDRLDKAMTVLDAHLPQRYQAIAVEHEYAGKPLAVEKVDRQAWLAEASQPARSQNPTPANTLSYAAEPTSGEPRLESQGVKGSLAPGLDFIHTLGGPEGFVLYQFSAALRGSVRLPTGTELKGMLRYRALDNYDKFKYDGISELPRVRTYMREYFTRSKLTLTNLSLSHTVRLSDNVHAAVYGGMFEEMFGGVGGEALYRKPGSSWALGLDVNRVRQRDFRQDLRFRDYQVDTGHLTAYWTTPWDGIQTSVAVGQYLAGDRGVTVTVGKTFANGSSMGAFATKTNVPASVFGEGSFDKGIFWSMPFDAFLTSSSRLNAFFAWKPLTRDGGARLTRPVSLYEQTQWLNPVAQSYRPAPPSNDNVVPDDRLDR